MYVSFATAGSFYGYVPEQFSYDEVECKGYEESIDECPHKNEHNCNQNEGAGVVCTNEWIETTPRPTLSTTSPKPEGNFFADIEVLSFLN